MKRRIYNLLTESKKTADPGWFVDAFIITLIMLNVVAIILESMESLSQQYQMQFYVFEIFSVIIFTVEYVLRVWTANFIRGYEKPITGNFKYALTPLALIDLFAFLPFYFIFMGVDLRFLRMLRIFRIFRLFKMVRYVEALSFISRVFKKKGAELMISLIFTIFLLIVTSTIVYYIENPAQPENFASIPKTMWWGIATLTTVGYGDIYPITPLGRFFGGIISIIGVLLFALPAGILSSGFSFEISRKKQHQGDHCPTCNQPIDAHDNEA